MKLLTLFVFSLICFTGATQPAGLPSWFTTAFKANLQAKYEIATTFKPAYILADFNGDGIQDIAVGVVDKITKKKGIVILHGKTNESYVFGAGNKFGNGGDDFKWIDKWSMYNKKVAHEPQFDKETGDILSGKQIKLSRPGLLVEDFEDGAALAGGIIYWTGKKYIWIHQGE